MPNAAEKYIKYIKELITSIEDQQMDKINIASRILTEAVLTQKKIWAFGCTHSAALTAEIYYRAGGLAIINGIFAPGMWLNEIPVTKTSRIENLSGYAKILLEEHDVKPDDVLLLFSTSGQNTVPIEMALEAKKINVKVIAITSLKYSNSLKSLHNDRKYLYEIADLVLDNGAEPGDAAIQFEQLKQKVGPVSTISGAMILNSIICQTVANLLEKGIEPPIFSSGNVDGGTEYNKAMLEKYRDSIKYL
jgi:Uncharacterized protein containing SIS (Sugar ISomerase) phosphosugar binding domain